MIVIPIQFLIALILGAIGVVLILIMMIVTFIQELIKKIRKKK